MTQATQQIELLRFSTAGSVDDGKSTLIGRLLYDSKTVFEDQLSAIQRTTERKQQDGVNLALLVDGLAAEREQGITIDVAYRYFSTPKRKFIIADTPGHEQYTRNMVTGASTADLALILVDASKGILNQSRRHLFISQMLGIKHIVVCINKMDLVDHSEGTFKKIVTDFENFTATLNIPDLQFIPISALNGDNVVNKSDKMPWYHGRALLDILETLVVIENPDQQNFRLPVQYVNRPDNNFRGFCGQVASGIIKPGNPIVVLPSGLTSTVTKIVSFDGDCSEAFAPQSITLTLKDEIDISRGDTLVSPDTLPQITHDFKARLCWMNEAPLQLKKKYIIKHGPKQSKAMITGIDSCIDINTLNENEASELRLNEIGQVQIKALQPLVLEAYSQNRATGSFILIDEMSNNTVAAGMVLI